MLCAYDMEKKGMSAYMAVAIALLIGLLFGIVQGFLVSYLEIQPFIVSPAGMFFGRGMTAIISTDKLGYFSYHQDLAFTMPALGYWK